MEICRDLYFRPVTPCFADVRLANACIGGMAAVQVNMARLAKAAGFKYLIYTTVHCDGFMNWPSNLTDYNIMNTPWGKQQHQQHQQHQHRHRVSHYQWSRGCAVPALSGVCECARVAAAARALP